MNAWSVKPLWEPAEDSGVGKQNEHKRDEDVVLEGGKDEDEGKAAGDNVGHGQAEQLQFGQAALRLLPVQAGRSQQQELQQEGGD